MEKIELEENKDDEMDSIETEFIQQTVREQNRDNTDLNKNTKKPSRSNYSTQLSSSISRVLKSDAMSSDVLVIGPSYSGKSLLIRRLQNLDSEIDADLQPTVGTDIVTLRKDKREFVIGFQLVASWVKFCLETRIFVVDISNSLDMAASAIEFFNILVTTNANETPVYLVLNKIDAADSTTLQTVEEFFQIQRLMQFRKNIQVFLVSAFLGANVRSLLKSLMEALSILNPTSAALAAKKKQKACCF